MEQWMIYTKKADFAALSEKYGISPVLARIMINREVQDFEEYLKCDISKMHSPWLLKDMDKAVDIIMEKISGKKHIRVIGDYDIDGVCSTYILTEGLRELGAVVDMDIPHRIKDGYGLNTDIIDRAIEAGVDTIITCDNGIAAMDEVSYAKKAGMTVIVTDHHEVPMDMGAEDEKKHYLRVSGDAVINPKQPDCDYPFKALCGAAVAMKLMMALYEKEKVIYPLNKFIELTAIATVGDVVDLYGENRTIVKHGLKCLKNPVNKGIRALMELCGIDFTNISSYHIGFVIGPCLNAGGRLETAKKAYELLNADSMDKAKEIAWDLKNLNEQRKEMTEEAVRLACLEADAKPDKKVLILYVKEAHESIAGIVAGRVREKYYRPVIVFTDSADEDVLKGSGRSIEGYNMYEELSCVSELFEKFGGHEMAAGMSIKKDKFATLEERLNTQSTMTSDTLTEKLWIDLQMPFSYITEKLVEELEVLEPFGKGNEKPQFAERDVEIKGFSIMGRNRNVLKMTVMCKDKYPMNALYFGDIEKLKNDIAEKYGEDEFKKLCIGKDNAVRMRIIYYPQINTYNGRNSLQIVIKKIAL